MLPDAMWATDTFNKEKHEEYSEMNRIPLLAPLLAVIVGLPLDGRAEEQKVIRLGMIGLDTSHVIAFTNYLNNPNNNTGCRVVAGFPGGSPDMPASADRVEKFTGQLREKHGLKIVDSIEAAREYLSQISRLLRSSDRGSWLPVHALASAAPTYGHTSLWGGLITSSTERSSVLSPLAYWQGSRREWPSVQLRGLRAYCP
jgi:hypothetical protein